MIGRNIAREDLPTNSSNYPNLTTSLLLINLGSLDKFPYRTYLLIVMLWIGIH